MFSVLIFECTITLWPAAVLLNIWRQQRNEAREQSDLASGVDGETNGVADMNTEQSTGIEEEGPQQPRPGFVKGACTASDLSEIPVEPSAAIPRTNYGPPCAASAHGYPDTFERLSMMQGATSSRQVTLKVGSQRSSPANEGSGDNRGSRQGSGIIRSGSGTGSINTRTG